MSSLEEVKCPYCGHKNEVTKDTLLDCVKEDGDVFEEECEQCEKTFVTIANIKVEYILSSRKIEYERCDKCYNKEEIGDLKIRGFVLPYPTDSRLKKLCKQCYYGEVQKDINETRKGC